MREARNRAPANLGPAELVAFVLQHSKSFKDVARRLESLQPNESAARILIEAYEQRELPSWLTALLLGCIGHACAYDTVKSILELDNPGGLAESYAGTAMVKISGDRAAKDLLEILEASPYSRSRAGAAFGLAEIESSEFSRHEIATRIITAVSPRHLRRDAASHALEQIGVTEEQLLALILSKNKNELRLARDLLRARYEGRTLRVPISRHVFDALHNVLDEDGSQLLDILRSDMQRLLDDASGSLMHPSDSPRKK